MEEECEDVHFMSYLVILIIAIILFLLFRNQIAGFIIWLLNSAQELIR